MTRVRSVTGLACSVRFPREWCSDRGLALAPRAECRRPQVDRVRGDELLAAPHTRLATPAVHLQLELEPAFLPGAGAVIAHRRAGRSHGPEQDVRDRRVQARELLERQLVRGLGRVDPRL